MGGRGRPACKADNLTDCTLRDYRQRRRKSVMCDVWPVTEHRAQQRKGSLRPLGSQGTCTSWIRGRVVPRAALHVAAKRKIEFVKAQVCRLIHRNITNRFVQIGNNFCAKTNIDNMTKASWFWDMILSNLNAASHSANHKFRELYGTRGFHCLVRKSLLLVPIFSQKNPVHTLSCPIILRSVLTSTSHLRVCLPSLIFLLCLLNLWSSGQSSCIQIQRSLVRFAALAEFRKSLERGPLSLVSITEELLRGKIAAPGLENRD
jgi:hypothetical protein